MTHPDLGVEAEALIRGLRGVAQVRISSSNDRIESIHVTASDNDAATHMASHVRSALLAGLAASVAPARIHVAVAASDATDGEPPRDRVRLLISDPAPQQPEQEDRAPTRPPTEEHRSGPGDAGEHPRSAAPPRLRLVAVDSDRPADGRVVCRVSVACGTRVQRAEATAVDLPGSAARAAAEAAAHAIADTGFVASELQGIRHVKIDGRVHAIVALRLTGPFTRTRSGSAPFNGSPERSAAEAVLAAAQELVMTDPSSRPLRRLDSNVTN